MQNSVLHTPFFFSSPVRIGHKGKCVQKTSAPCQERMRASRSS